MSRNDRNGGASWRRRGVAAVAAVVIGVTGCGLIVGAGPAQAANPDICPPTVSNAQAHPAAAGPAEDLVLWFAKAAASRAAGAAFGFVMSQLGLGDRTGAQLAAISEQLARMDAKLDRLQESANEIKRRVDEAEFTTMMIRFNALKARIDSINRNGMQEIARAAENLAKVMSSPGTPEQREEAIAEATACLNQKKIDFAKLATDRGADTNVGEITSLLSSSAGEGTLVNGYGRLLLPSSRYLTHKHSEALRAFYDYLEQYQALAAIQRAEWQVATGRSRETIQRDNEEFHSEIGTAPGTIQRQRLALPDPIPKGAVIDLGTGHETTTIGKTMYFPLGGVENGPKETTWRDPDLQGWFTGSAEAPRVAAEFDGPFPPLGQAAWKDWQIINAPLWGGLVAGKKDSELGTAYLNRLFSLTSGIGGLREPFGESSWVWINHRRNHEMTMKKGTRRTQKYYFPLTVRVRLDRSGPMANVERPPAEWAPELPRAQGPRSKPQVAQVVEQAYAAARASLILTRKVDVSYMALKSGAP